MLETRLGKDAKIAPMDVSKDVDNLLKTHKEVLIIATSKNDISNDETDISVITKFLDKDSVLTSMLCEILNKLTNVIKLNE